MMMQQHFINNLGYEIHYTAWGQAHNPALVLWHGLTRTGRDFDELAQAMSEHYYVLCPDTLGRGLSQWSQYPIEEYVPAFYAEMALDMLQQLGIERCAWVGTSMGGLIAMLVAAKAPKLFSRLVINDVAPEVPQPALERIKAYVGLLPEFESYAALQQWIEQVYVPFGVNSRAFWQRMAQTSARRQDNGLLTLHYDPALVEPFKYYQAAETLWAEWAGIDCPTLIVQGEQSDILSPALAQKMLVTNPQADLVQWADVGHAPTLATAEQIKTVRDFLLPV